MSSAVLTAVPCLSGVLNGASPFFYGVGVAARIGVTFLENSLLHVISTPIHAELFLLYSTVPLSSFLDIVTFFDIFDVFEIVDIMVF